jgi:two-component system, LytTR family, response regulator
MIRAIIVDDEPGSVFTLQKLLESYCPGIMVTATANDIEKAAELIRSQPPDLLFLDIEMPRGNGFDLLELLRPVHFEVVFVTAFNEYSIKAFKYSALDYLLKPLSISDLQEATEKAAKKIKEKNVHLRIENLLNNLSGKNSLLQKITLPTQEGLLFVPVNNIIRCEASRNYTCIYINSGEKIIVSKTLKEYEELLPGEIFCRVHHAHLINLNYVKKYHKGRGGYIEMDDGASIEVSVRKKEEFMTKIARH